MFPHYQFVDTNGYKLPDDDKRGVQALYGSRTPPEPEDPDTLRHPSREQCSRSLVFDAAASIRGDLYFFKNGYYWQKSTAFLGMLLVKVSSVWEEIQHVDAAYENPNDDKFFLFDGRQYWGIRAYAKTMIPGYPKLLTNLGLPSWLNKVDAAVYVTSIGKTLIFASNQYWSYDEARNQMDQGYPRYITQDFPGIGSRVDAAFEAHGHLYFSNGPRLSEYYLPYRRVMRDLLNYSWLDCY
ncbi:hypothetical protein WMY93_029388 [Mugilogobius chulae]|uniref:Matrix metalloproteinase-13 n=1 Tax=Mugilogobius chulae TaxID=88201 RepID=A0AAW0MV89_9GOBI